MSMAALPLRRSRRGSGNLFFFTVATRQRLNFWKFFVYFYRKNL
jgi:hypothetical protein